MSAANGTSSSSSEGADLTRAPLRALAHSSEEATRVDAVSAMHKWLKRHPNLDLLDYMKLWKGLWFSFWHADKKAFQTIFAVKIVKLLEAIPEENQTTWMGAFWMTAQKNWTTLDRVRLDKYLLLVRIFLAETFAILKKKKWDPEFIAELNLMLRSAGPLRGHTGSSVAPFDPRKGERDGGKKRELTRLEKSRLAKQILKQKAKENGPLKDRRVPEEELEAAAANPFIGLSAVPEGLGVSLHFTDIFLDEMRVSLDMADGSVVVQPKHGQKGQTGGLGAEEMKKRWDQRIENLRILYRGIPKKDKTHKMAAEFGPSEFDLREEEATNTLPLVEGKQSHLPEGTVMLLLEPLLQAAKYCGSSALTRRIHSRVLSRVLSPDDVPSLQPLADALFEMAAERNIRRENRELLYETLKEVEENITRQGPSASSHPASPPRPISSPSRRLSPSQPKPKVPSLEDAEEEGGAEADEEEEGGWQKVQRTSKRKKQKEKQQKPPPSPPLPLTGSPGGKQQKAGGDAGSLSPRCPPVSPVPSPKRNKDKLSSPLLSPGSPKQRERKGPPDTDPSSTPVRSSAGGRQGRSSVLDFLDLEPHSMSSGGSSEENEGPKKKKKKSLIDKDSKSKETTQQPGAGGASSSSSSSSSSLSQLSTEMLAMLKNGLPSQGDADAAKDGGIGAKKKKKKKGQKRAGAAEGEGDDSPPASSTEEEQQLFGSFLSGDQQKGAAAMGGEAAAAAGGGASSSSSSSSSAPPASGPGTAGDDEDGFTLVMGRGKKKKQKKAQEAAAAASSVVPERENVAGGRNMGRRTAVPPFGALAKSSDGAAALLAMTRGRGVVRTGALTRRESSGSVGSVKRTTKIKWDLEKNKETRFRDKKPVVTISPANGRRSLEVAPRSADRPPPPKGILKPSPKPAGPPEGRGSARTRSASSHSQRGGR
uniref:Uncharacterized protein n=1 Tax=Chromera velia CCMP2878 TaxID=1169474 RepID=A0A0G4I4F8_9ALVE|eukprot:Cvel_1801.t1-p1 / transcript=Cvel_1801.t1 / gene=Cvel_1801 / organism=Chromera_velia_CCMP2878 / gene_product=Ribosomal RNA-processing protein 1 homolog, putative / transcript_product=Ribosomal RNA-processing protein 1 homolog, putative / location=Cvel_scaffold66:64246-69509(+) / protein_length=930 / sequence_SO=supercontig / SO=protein_coding / is_pseudo=false